MRVLPHLAALVIVIGSGVLHGLWTGRWRTTRELDLHVERLGQVPMMIGGWRGRDLTLDRRTMEMAEIDGYLMRRYEDRRGDVVTVLVVCGRPGPIAVHTPDVCYGGIGFELSEPKTKQRLDAGRGRRPDELWVADFVKQDSILPQRLRILYGWTTDGTWSAMEQPRRDFAGASILHKIYLVRETTQGGGATPGDPGIQFARQLLPQLRKSLFPTP